MKKHLVYFLVFLFILTFSGCRSQKTNSNSEIPDDFSFSLTWDCYGISSYDSETGKLVKTTDTDHPEDYTAFYQLTDADKAYIYRLISDLDVHSYPDVYNPSNISSKPPMTLILTVCSNGTEKTIEAKNIAASFESEDKKGQLFLSTCKALRDLLTATAEWQALPDYENTYA